VINRVVYFATKNRCISAGNNQLAEFRYADCWQRLRKKCLILGDYSKNLLELALRQN